MTSNREERAMYNGRDDSPDKKHRSEARQKVGADDLLREDIIRFKLERDRLYTLLLKAEADLDDARAQLNGEPRNVTAD